MNLPYIPITVLARHMLTADNLAMTDLVNIRMLNKDAYYATRGILTKDQILNSLQRECPKLMEFVMPSTIDKVMGGTDVNLYSAAKIYKDLTNLYENKPRAATHLSEHLNYVIQRHPLLPPVSRRPLKHTTETLQFIYAMHEWVSSYLFVKKKRNKAYSFRSVPLLYAMEYIMLWHVNDVEYLRDHGGFRQVIYSKATESVEQIDKIRGGVEKYPHLKKVYDVNKFLISALTPQKISL